MEITQPHEINNLSTEFILVREDNKLNVTTTTNNYIPILKFLLNWEKMKMLYLFFEKTKLICLNGLAYKLSFSHKYSENACGKHLHIGKVYVGLLELWKTKDSTR